MDEERFEDEIYTLTDEEGNQSEFELLGTIEEDGAVYYALVPLEDNENNEYVILKSEDEDTLATIDDDDEFNRIADRFDEEFFSEIDYDETDEPEED